MAQTEVLGSRMNSLTLVIRGCPSEKQSKTLLEEIIKIIEMTPIGKPQIWRYPLSQGEGGVGETIIQNCYTMVQPLVESYGVVMVPGLVGVDTWKELDGFYLIINSCRRIPIDKLRQHIRKEWTILDFGYDSTGIVKGKPKSFWGRLCEFWRIVGL